MTTHNQPVRITKGAHSIQTVQDWFAYAPPKGGAKQWKKGFSAQELATAWCGSGAPALPPEIAQLFCSHSDFAAVILDEVIPEQKLWFDKLFGEPRNTDLAISASVGGLPLAITVEGKAHESFDRTVKKVLDAGNKIILQGKRTNIHARVQTLIEALLPPLPPNTGPSLLAVPAVPSLPALGDLRYQLLTATAGTLAYAEALNADRALLIVHEFVGTPTTPREVKAVQQNAEDLDAFVTRLSGGKTRTVPLGQIVGPFLLRGGGKMRENVAFYIGKARR